MAGKPSRDDAFDLPFEIPESWKTARLSELCEFIRDGDWIESKDQGGSDFRLLQISNIGVGRFIETSNYRWITKETFARLNCTEILEGDVLVARMPEPTGRAWFVSALPWRAVTAVDVAIVRTRRKELDPRFLAYFLNSPASLAQVASLTTGTTRLRIRRADLEQRYIPVPPIAEQRAIAHILGALDDKIEVNRRMSETPEEMARGLFESWFVRFDPVRAKMEGRDPGLPADLADLFPDRLVDSELGEVPAGWEIGTFGAIIKERTERVAGRQAVVLSAVSSGKLVPSEEFFNKRVHSRDISRYLLVEQGDFAYNPARINIGSIGMLQDDVVGAVSPVYVVFRPRKEFGWFLEFSLRRASVRAWIETLASGSVRQTLSYRDFASIPCVIPPVQLVEEFNKRWLTLREGIRSRDAESRTLAEIRDTLLPKLISGELRVQDAERLVAAAT